MAKHQGKTMKIFGSNAAKSPQTAIASTPPAAGRSARLAFSPSMRDALSFPVHHAIPTPDDIRKLYGPARTLGAPEEVRVAMDHALENAGLYSLLQHGIDLGVYGSSANFLGYAALQNIAQNGLIRACVETVSDDMTRNWIELTREGESDDQDANGRDDKLDEINKEFDRLELQKVLHEASSMTGYYGGCLVYLDTGASGEYLKHPLNLDPLFSLEARNKGFLKAVRCIDPINVFPGTYNAIDPLAADYYKPSTWWVLGKQVHASRLIRIVANEAPLIFKPNYNFLGIPQAQILWDYVLHFQQNRDAANRLLNKFSMLIFKTAMSDILEGYNGLDQLDTRMQMLARTQSNDGVFAIDREAEDVVKVETPLSGVTDIVKQSLEQLAAMNRTPAVKLLGISPSGFNATGESDLRNYYDHVLSQQEKMLRPAIKDILDVVQISLFGEVDAAIDFTFKQLSEDDKNATAMTQQVKANTLCALLDRDIISPEEARRVLIADPSSGLNTLDPDELPEPDEEGEMSGAQGDLAAPVNEEIDEADLAENSFAMDAASDDLEWRSLENGQPFPVKEGQTIKEAAQNFIASKKKEVPIKHDLSAYAAKISGEQKKQMQKDKSWKKISQLRQSKALPEQVKSNLDDADNKYQLALMNQRTGTGSQSEVDAAKKNLDDAIAGANYMLNDPAVAQSLKSQSKQNKASQQAQQETQQKQRTAQHRDNEQKTYVDTFSDAEIKQRLEQAKKPETEIAGVKKTAPMSHEQAANGSLNPDSGENSLLNCQESVMAYEARRRGADVQAAPFDANSSRDRNTTHAWINRETGKGPQLMMPDNMFISGKQYAGYLDDTIKDGERYHLLFAWKGTNEGHIITAQKENNQLVLYDPQKNTTYKGKQIDDLMQKVDMPKPSQQKPQPPLLYRVDNLAFNDDVARKSMTATKR